MQEKKFDWLGFSLVSYLCMYGIVTASWRLRVEDIQYLCNRAEQMLSCLKDGILPFFYYNDFSGVGYGSSFFYGQLTLYPFLPFIAVSESAFINMYYIVTVALTYVGAKYLASKFTKNARFIAVLYMCSYFGVWFIYGSNLLSCCLGVAISFFFLGACIEFFRDDKSFYKASILFFILFNTHLVTSVVSFLICVFLFLIYFNKLRLKEYIKFAGVTTLICFYTICNMLYHSDILTRSSNIATNLLPSTNSVTGSLFLSVFPFKGILLSQGVASDSQAMNLFNLAISIVVVYCLVKRYKSLTKREIFGLSLFGVAYIISNRVVWEALSRVHTIPIQFPVRYFSYMAIVLLIIAFRYVDFKKAFKGIIFCLCLPELLLFAFCLDTGSRVYGEVEYSKYIANGDYLDSSFVFNQDSFNYYKQAVYDQDMNAYDFSIDKDKLVVDIPEHNRDLELTFPKLYYRGYVLTGDGYDFDVEIGYSQFIKSNIGDYSGTLTLQYKHPVWLIVLDIISYLGVVSLVFLEIGGYNYVKKITRKNKF